MHLKRNLSINVSGHLGWNKKTSNLHTILITSKGNPHKTGLAAKTGATS